MASMYELTQNLVLSALTGKWIYEMRYVKSGGSFATAPRRHEGVFHFWLQETRGHTAPYKNVHDFLRHPVYQNSFRIDGRNFKRLCG